jgi:hypothetical protein
VAKETRTYTLTLFEEMLGTKAGNKEVYEDYIASKRPDGIDPKEVETLPLEDEIEKGSTLFCRNEYGNPIIFDYQVKGFFKDSQGALSRTDDAAQKLTAYKKVIDGCIFVFPRQIDLEMPEETKPGWCERPLRAQTMQGERVSLARSETVPAGTQLTIKIMVLNPKHWKHVEQWLDYGELRGLGQWRNSGKGRFTWEQVEMSEADPNPGEAAIVKA